MTPPYQWNSSLWFSLAAFFFLFNRWTPKMRENWYGFRLNIKIIRVDLYLNWTAILITSESNNFERKFSDLLIVHGEFWVFWQIKMMREEEKQRKMGILTLFLFILYFFIIIIIIKIILLILLVLLFIHFIEENFKKSW